VRTALIIFLLPSLDVLLRFRQRPVSNRVREFNSKHPVEGFDVSLVGRFSRSTEADLNSVSAGPRDRDLTSELGFVKLHIALTTARTSGGT